jgi:hypothetical protein
MAVSTDPLSASANNNDDRPVVPIAGIVYGDIIYWVTIVATVVVLIGSVMTFVTMDNYMDATYLLSSIWQGKNVEQIWVGAVGAQPNSHWYLAQLNTGSGLTEAGIALGVASVIPAIIGSAYILLRERQRLFGGLAIVAAIITTAAVVGF